MKGSTEFLLGEKRKISFGDEAGAFIDAVVAYFPDGTIYTDPSTSGTRMLQQFDSHRENIPTGVETMKFHIDEVIRQHREKWSRVCEAFASLKVTLAQRK